MVNQFFVELVEKGTCFREFKDIWRQLQPGEKFELPESMRNQNGYLSALSYLHDQGAIAEDGTVKERGLSRLLKTVNRAERDYAVSLSLPQTSDAEQNFLYASGMYMPPFKLAKRGPRLPPLEVQVQVY